MKLVLVTEEKNFVTEEFFEHANISATLKPYSEIHLSLLMRGPDGLEAGKTLGLKNIQTVPLISEFSFYINRQYLKHTQFDSEVRIAIVALAILTGYVALCHAAAATADTPHPEVVLTRDNS